MLRKRINTKELNIADGWNVISLKFIPAYVTYVLYLSALKSSSIVESLFFSCLNKNSLETTLWILKPPRGILGVWSFLLNNWLYFLLLLNFSNPSCFSSEETNPWRNLLSWLSLKHHLCKADVEGMATGQHNLQSKTVPTASLFLQVVTYFL